jgi:hypothetical protein
LGRHIWYSHKAKIYLIINSQSIALRELILTVEDCFKGIEALQIREQNIGLKESDFPSEAIETEFKKLFELRKKVESARPKNETTKRVLAEGITTLIQAIGFGSGILAFSLVVLLAWATIKESTSTSTIPNFGIIIFLFVLLLLGITIPVIFNNAKNETRARLIKYFKFPSSRFLIYQYLASIAECIEKGERRCAIRFFFNLHDLVANYPDVRSKSFRKRVNTVMRNLGTDEFYNFFLFSNKRDLPAFLLNIGLATVHNDFPKINSLINEMCKDDCYVTEKSKFKIFMDITFSQDNWKFVVQTALQVIIPVIFIWLGIVLGFKIAH